MKLDTRTSATFAARVDNDAREVTGYTPSWRPDYRQNVKAELQLLHIVWLAMPGQRRLLQHLLFLNSSVVRKNHTMNVQEMRPAAPYIVLAFLFLFPRDPFFAMRTRFCLSVAIGVSLLLSHDALGQNPEMSAEGAQYLQNVHRVDATLNRFDAMKPSLLRLDSEGQDRMLPANRFSSIANIFLLTEQIGQDWDMTANDWMNSSRVAWTRNSAGFATEQLIESWDAAGGVWSPEGRTTFDLNSQNRSELTLTEGWNPDANGGQGGYEPAQRVTSTYDGDGNALTRTTEIWDEGSGTWLLWNRSTSSYENGNLVQQTSESLDFFTGMLRPSLRTNFEYDGAGRTISRIRETYDDATSAWENSSRRLWTYDGNGFETEDLEQSWDEAQGDWVNDFREVTTYEGTPSDPISETVTAQDWDPGAGAWVNRDRGVFTINSSTEWVQLEQDWDPIANDWVNRDQEIITLNSNGDFVEFVSQSWDSGQNAWVNEDRGTAEYNNEGLATVFTNQIWDGSQWVNDSRLLQSYGEFTGTAVEETPEGRFTLEASYPNPFREETTIRYSLPSTQNVTVEVFDLLGRRVMTLVDGPSAPGTHSLKVDGAELAGGLYVYRLKSSAVTLSRTMMLVK